jgi:hypothetical protein
MNPDVTTALSSRFVCCIPLAEVQDGHMRVIRALKIFDVLNVVAILSKTIRSVGFNLHRFASRGVEWGAMCLLDMRSH